MTIIFSYSYQAMLDTSMPSRVIAVEELFLFLVFF